MSLLVAFFVVIAALVGLASAAAQQPASVAASMVLTNGKIVTLDEARPQVEALAIGGNQIAAMGTAAAMARHIGQRTQVIDLMGRLVIPGFVESHAHFTGIGRAQLDLNLTKAKSWNEIVRLVAESVRIAKPGQWIYGRGWHQEKWAEPPQPNVEGFPTHDSLSKVSPHNPVLLTHASGHATFANAKAMQLSAVTAVTPNPAGGDLLRDADGQPTGLFRETASRLIRAGTGEPPLSSAERAVRARRIMELASQEVLSKGITSFHDAGATFEDVDLMKALIDEGKINVRLWVMLRESNEALAARLAKYRLVDYADGFLTVRAIKRSIDGALGSRGAWLLEEYSDKPGDTGRNTTPVDEIRATARLALEHGYQLCVHAIGDRGNRETLNIFAEALGTAATKNALRWRVEHAQHIHPDDLPRFARLGVIASMQGIHCTSDAPFVVARLGENRAREGAYVWQTLMRSGAVVTNGTDAPVEDVDPIASFHASITRRLQDGRVFFGEERMTRLQALRSYTIHGAYAAFEDNTRGSLTPGKYADLVVLSKDILTIPDEEIRSAEVMYTIVGGKIRYARTEAASR